MVKTNPKKIPGRWREGFALDIHTVKSVYVGEDQFGHPQFETTRSEVGEMLYRLKYQHQRPVAGQLAKVAADFVRKWKVRIDLVVPVPPTRNRVVQPVLLVAEALAKRLGVDYAPGGIKKRRAGQELKDVYDYDKRLKLLDGLHAIGDTRIKGKKVLLFDDLYRSGATMNAITNVLYDQGHAKEVYALALTRTRSRQ